MNPVILDINLFNSFNSIWINIGLSAGNAINAIQKSVGQLCEKIVETTSAIQVLQGELGDLNESFVRLNENVMEANTKLSVGFYSTNVDANKTTSILNSYRQSEPENSIETVYESKNGIVDMLEKVNKPLSRINSLKTLFTTFKGELPAAMKGLFEVSETASAAIDVIGMVAEGGLLESLLLSGGELALLAGATGPVGWIVGTAALITEALYAATRESPEQKKRETEEAIYSLKQDPGMERFEYRGNELTRHVKNGYDIIPQIKIKEMGARELNKLILPYVEIEDPEIQKMRSNIKEIQDNALFNSGFSVIGDKTVRKAVNTKHLSAEINQAVNNSSLPKWKFTDPAVIPRLPTNAEFDTYYPDKSYRAYFSDEEFKIARPDEYKRLHTPASALSVGKLGERTSKSSAITVNFTKPMIGNLTINVKDSKEAMKDFKHKVEEALLEIINSVNSSN